MGFGRIIARLIAVNAFSQYSKIFLPFNCIMFYSIFRALEPRSKPEHSYGPRHSYSFHRHRKRFQHYCAPLRHPRCITSSWPILNLLILLEIWRSIHVARQQRCDGRNYKHWRPSLRGNYDLKFHNYF